MKKLFFVLILSFFSQSIFSQTLGGTFTSFSSSNQLNYQAIGQPYSSFTNHTKQSIKINQGQILPIHFKGIKNLDFNLSLFPNPTQNQVNLVCDLKNDIDNIRLFDIQGKEIKSLVTRITGQHVQVKVDGLVPGVYNVEVS
ncbi:MAG: T9SS type A sorting domain-containing protein, partial [Bacteroidia bacterium]